MNRTKIVCTIGPASEGFAMGRKMIRAGMNVARLNFSHGTHDQHKANCDALRAAAKAEGRPLAVMQDLQGPKIRVGIVDEPGIRLVPGKTVIVTHGSGRSTPEVIATEYEHIVHDLRPGEDVLIDDGKVRLSVISRSKSGARCRVTAGGLVTSHKGINLPGTNVSSPALTEKDKDDLDFGLGLGVDYVALSFVRRAKDVEDARRIIEAHRSPAKICAKIEKPEGLENIDSILKVVDAVMVARGDLGVEMPVERIPLEQKVLISKANAAKRPVIVATQMLESMITNPIPTRAEATDVANAVFDGADAVMLSAESAAGKYPVASVETMARIVSVAEGAPGFDAAARMPHGACYEPGGLPVPDAVCDAVSRAAADVGAKLIVVFTQSGSTATYLSKYRPHLPVLAFTPDTTVYNQLSLLRGIEPRLMPFKKDTDSLVESAVKWLLDGGHVRRGDVVAMAAGMPIAGRGTTNFMKLHRV